MGGGTQSTKWRRLTERTTQDIYHTHVNRSVVVHIECAYCVADDAKKCALDRKIQEIELNHCNTINDNHYNNNNNNISNKIHTLNIDSRSCLK